MITAINAKKLGCTIKDDAAMAIAIRSRWTPRISVNYLYWCRDFAQKYQSKDLTLELVEGAMKDKGIDAMGLLPIDRKYLKLLYDDYYGGPAGKVVLSHELLIAEETLESDIEPYLTSKGLVMRIPKGRQLTTAGMKLAPKLKVDLE
jgi:Holliday junction DNA helicase RuvB